MTVTEVGPLATRTTVPRGRFDLAVFEGGDPDGPTVVMVHGWPDTHDLWQGVAEVLGRDHRVVAYDTRGRGESVLDAPDSDFSLDLLADDLFAVLDAVSPDAPVHLLGHDWGSVQAWEAVCRPGAEARIASFTSISGPNLDHVALWMRRALARPSLSGCTGLLGQVLSSSYVPFLVSPIAPPLLGLVDRDAAGGLRYYRANLLRGARARRRTTSVPVLQLELAHDPAVRAASLAASEPWTDSLERRRLPNGHWAPRTHPEVVAAEAARFVREHDSEA